MPQSVRHGKQRPVVHPVQVEEGLLQIRRLIQSHDWRTRLNDVKYMTLLNVDNDMEFSPPFS